MLSRINSVAILGIEGIPVIVETDINSGLPNFNIVGLADTMVKEAKERIRSAIINSGNKFPMNRITMNLAPASLRKRGSHFDLPMALGILTASGVVSDINIDEYAFIGELSLDGNVNKTKGVLPMVLALKKNGCRKIILPDENKIEAGLIKNIEVLPVKNLNEVIDHLNMNKEIKPFENNYYLNNREFFESNLDFVDVRGQESAKRAIIIAVAGGHSLLMTGSPSTGKTMISERIPTVMPELTDDEIVSTSIIYSVAGMLSPKKPYIFQRPFRKPYCNITPAGLLGGGIVPLPGEITLAHNGVLFLDEFGEYDKKILDALRVPLEEKKISIVRKGETYNFPSDFMLVGATNPCKCGYKGDPTHKCKCSQSEIDNYHRKLSGPILDRIDMHMNLMPVSYKALNDSFNNQTSKEMKNKITRARDIQSKRYSSEHINLNSQLDSRNVDKYCNISLSGQKLLSNAYDKMKLNPRTFLKIKKISRTIADIEDKEIVDFEHIAEALQYRESTLTLEEENN